MRDFYNVANTGVVLPKGERNAIWKDFKSLREIPVRKLEQQCPALLAELQKALDHDALVQSAIFSECAYAQTIANMFGLLHFYNYSESPNCLDANLVELLHERHLLPRYVYKSANGRKVLVQAGGPNGTDGALIDLEKNDLFTIEFKEAGAKTSEPDLPNYGEDGFLVTDAEYLENNSQFEAMLSEQIGNKLNFWNVMGSNVNDFDPLNVQVAVTKNYGAKKFADVICVEDSKSILTMLPANQVIYWANIRGEIRPAGRNRYPVWTPKKLQEFILEMGGTIEGSNIKIGTARLDTAKKRGGNDDVNRYKINSIFFVYAKNLSIQGDQAHFKIDNVRQLKPTISAHMFFKELSVNKVRARYEMEIHG